MMENPNDKKQSEALYSPNPPLYSEKQPAGSYQQYPPGDGPAPSMGFAANPAMPPQYQSYGVVPGQGPITQPPQHTTFVVPVQATHEPDYLAYSIFTMLCCCLPLGIAALVYSIQTRDANHNGNGVAARRNSRMARILAHTALGLGIVFLIIYIVLVVVINKR